MKKTAVGIGAIALVCLMLFVSAWLGYRYSTYQHRKAVPCSFSEHRKWSGDPPDPGKFNYDVFVVSMNRNIARGMRMDLEEKIIDATDPEQVAEMKNEIESWTQAENREVELLSQFHRHGAP